MIAAISYIIAVPLAAWLCFHAELQRMESALRHRDDVIAELLRERTGVDVPVVQVKHGPPVDYTSPRDREINRRRKAAGERPATFLDAMREKRFGV